MGVTEARDAAGGNKGEIQTQRVMKPALSPTCVPPFNHAFIHSFISKCL